MKNVRTVYQQLSRERFLGNMPNFRRDSPTTVFNKVDGDHSAVVSP